MRFDTNCCLSFLKQPSGELPEGRGTVLAAVYSHRQQLPEDYANVRSLVSQRLESLEVSEWSFPDLANNLFLTGQPDALRVAEAVRMDGAAFQGLVDRKGKRNTYFVLPCAQATRYVALRNSAAAGRLYDGRVMDLGLGNADRL